MNNMGSFPNKKPKKELANDDKNVTISLSDKDSQQSDETSVSEAPTPEIQNLMSLKESSTRDQSDPDMENYQRDSISQDSVYQEITGLVHLIVKHVDDEFE